MLRAREPFEEAHQLYGRFVDNAAVVKFARDAFRPGFIHLIQPDERIIVFLTRHARLIENAR